MRQIDQIPKIGDEGVARLESQPSGLLALVTGTNRIRHHERRRRSRLLGRLGVKGVDRSGARRGRRWAGEPELVEITAMCLELIIGLVQGFQQNRGGRVDVKNSSTIKADTASLELQVSFLGIVDKVSIHQRELGWAVFVQQAGKIGDGDRLEAVRAADRGNNGVGLVVTDSRSRADGQSKNRPEGGQGVFIEETRSGGLDRAGQRSSSGGQGSSHHDHFFLFFFSAGWG